MNIRCEALAVPQLNKSETSLVIKMVQEFLHSNPFFIKKGYIKRFQIMQTEALPPWVPPVLIFEVKPGHHKCAICVPRCSLVQQLFNVTVFDVDRSEKRTSAADIILNVKSYESYWGICLNADTAPKLFDFWLQCINLFSKV